jgi:hypothetical protein
MKDVPGVEGDVARPIALDHPECGFGRIQTVLGDIVGDLPGDDAQGKTLTVGFAAALADKLVGFFEQPGVDAFPDEGWR